MDTLTIVGVGLIGASVGLAAKRRGIAGRVLGVGHRRTSLQKAVRRGAIDGATTDLDKGVAQADLIVVCTPVAAIVATIEQAAAACRPDCLLTDVGSTKRTILRALAKSLPPSARYVGSHPMAGGEQTGPDLARDDLFDGRVTVVTPTRRTRRDDLAAVTEFWRALGSRIVEMSPAEHDRAVAATSHMPHLGAAAIAAATPSRYAQTIANGWLDTTRIAAGDPELWTQIVRENRDQVLASVLRLERAVVAFRKALDRDDPRAMKQLLTKAKNSRDALGS